MEIPNSLSYKSQLDQDSLAKRSSRGEDQKRRENSIHEEQDDHQTHNQRWHTNPKPRREPDPPDPTRILSQPKPISTTRPTIRYRECQKNHAAHLGSHVVDGCGEFMPNGEEGTPEAMRCAACDCHRNFHRKEIEAAAAAGGGGVVVPRNRLYHPPTFQQAPPSHHRRISYHPHSTVMAFGGGVHGESSGEDLNQLRSDGEGYDGGGSSRKRFRTKFTQEQKERMVEFAQKIGWKIQKQDELEVQHFCEAAGVKRQVFKVWMHNNKQAMRRKQS